MINSLPALSDEQRQSLATDSLRQARELIFNAALHDRVVTGVTSTDLIEASWVMMDQLTSLINERTAGATL